MSKKFRDYTLGEDCAAPAKHAARMIIAKHAEIRIRLISI